MFVVMFLGNNWCVCAAFVVVYMDATFQFEKDWFGLCFLVSRHHIKIDIFIFLSKLHILLIQYISERGGREMGRQTVSDLEKQRH